MVVAVPRPSSLDHIREQHWLELSRYLGMPSSQVRRTLDYWFALLEELGYELKPKGANRGHRFRQPGDEKPVAVPSQIDLYHAVDGALSDIARRRAKGERVSDQAETRAIVENVLNHLLSASGTSDD